ncbi:hypothetical protein QBC47DRAFT_386808 [Echria macrotheca]|uniref:Uncharacterized protein n=1 Tax=Echria macrotheca TaxID=438768 RepID=A0AAJ0F7R7_9PEZI|nr:hypothetical protein QBC47DRAFT_386808 [Echria macrotheca]
MPSASALFGMQGVNYDRVKTLAYQDEHIQGLSYFTTREWQDTFSSFQGPVPTEIHCPTADFIWKIDTPARLQGANVQFHELGLDEDGYPCEFPLSPAPGGGRSSESGSRPRFEDSAVGREIEEHIQIPIHSASRSERLDTCHWAGHRFGREWKFDLNGVSDNILFCIAGIQLCSHSVLLGKRGRLSSARQRLVEAFLDQFRGTWDLSRNLWGTSDHSWPGPGRFNTPQWEDLVFQYHMRGFKVTTPIPGSSQHGRGLTRASGPLRAFTRNETGHGDDPGHRIREFRYSVGLKTTWEMELPVYTIVTMVDSLTATDTSSSGESRQPSVRDAWEASGIRPCIRGTGLAAFAFRIYSLLSQWEAQWSSLIDQIRVGRVLSNDVNLHAVLSPRHADEALVDDSDLRLSKLYLTIIQLLRIAADWIQESMDDLRSMVKDLKKHYLGDIDTQLPTFLPAAYPSVVRQEAIEIFEENWRIVILRQQEIGNKLLGRIAAQQEETNRLTANLFSVTTISETIKARQLNRYIFIFTVVTIFFVPLSFVTSLFALELFDWRNPNLVKWFTGTIVLVAGITYLSSGLSLWVVRGPSWRQGFAWDRVTLFFRLLIYWAVGRLWKRWRRRRNPPSELGV